jgi:hypothetical protein
LKKILTILILGILVFSGIGATAFTNEEKINEDIIEKTVTFSEPIIIDEGQYVIISLEEETSSISEVGKPKMPVVTQVFTFPFGTKINSVDIRFSNKNYMYLSKEIIPAPEPIPIGMETKIVKSSAKDSKVYGSNKLYPKSNFDFDLASGIKNGENVVYLILRLYPVSYSPVQNTIFYYKNADISVNFEESTNQINDIYDMVIITPSKFTESLQPLIDHKNSYEVETTIKTTEEIYDEYEGYDEAEEIKLFIKDAIETWGVEYVLLFGSVDILPIRTTWIHQRWHNHYWNLSILCDLYFSDVYDEFGDFCSWDSDGDGKYGEFYNNCPGVNDTVDLFPDVNLGRLACQNLEDVETVINKIIHYEKNTYGKDWFNTIVLVGGDTFPGWGQNEGEVLNNIIEGIMSDFTAKKLWTSDRTFTAFKLNLALYGGAGFFDYSGHGFTTHISTHPPNRNRWVVYHNNNLNNLRNGNKLPIVFFDACLTAKLDYNKSGVVQYTPLIVNHNLFSNFFRTFSKIINRIFNNFKTKNIPKNVNKAILQPAEDSDLVPCFAWNWLIKSNGGGIATIGATRVAFGGYDSGAGKLSIEFFSGYEESETVGEMMSKAQFGYIMDVPWDYFTVEEFVLLGDPSLKIGGYP